MLVKEILRLSYRALGLSTLHGDDPLLFKTVDGSDDSLPGEISRLLEMPQANKPAVGFTGCLARMPPSPLDDGQCHRILPAAEPGTHESVEDIVSYLPVVPLLLRINLR